MPAPDITIEPSTELIKANKEGWISAEAMDHIYQALDSNLREGHGFISADAVGLGKSRQAAGFAWELLKRGYKRIVMTTRNEATIRGGDGLLAEFNKAAGGSFPYPIVIVRDVKEASIRSAEAKRGERGGLPTYDKGAVYMLDYYAMERYLEAILELQPDAVIGDEAHLFRNETAKVGAAWDQIHKTAMQDPKAAFLYLTATVAQDAEDLRYLHGLRLWSNFDEWLAKMTGKLAWRAGTQAEYAEPERNTSAWVAWKLRSRGLEFINRQAQEGVAWSKFPSLWDQTTKWLNEMKDAGEVSEELAREYSYRLERPTVQGLLEEAELQILYKGVDKDAQPETLTEKDRRGYMKKSTLFEHSIPPAEIEQWMRELKMQRYFGSRELWRGDAEFEFIEQKLAKDEAKLYDDMREVARDATVLFMKYGRMNKRRRTFSNRAWVQAFLKRAQFQFKLKYVLDRAEQDLASGHQPVISLINVNETKEDEGNIHTAIEVINTEHVEKNPGEEGGFIEHGEIPEALAEKAELAERARALPTLASPLALVQARFGRENVANVTGATSEGKPWSSNNRMQDLAAFQAGKKLVLVLSGAGKIGISAHHVVPIEGEAKGRRTYHIADYEWSAITLYQELGRVDRTGQLTGPKFVLWHSGTLADRKFVASVANRMKTVGATSRGSADVGAGGELAAFEFGGKIDTLALRRAYEKAPGRIQELFTYAEFKNPWEKDKPVHERRPARATTASPKQFLMDFQLMPASDLQEFQELWLKEREAIENEGLFDTSGNRTGRDKGTILRSTGINESLILHEVEATKQDGGHERMGILQGITTPYMSSILESIGRDSNGDLPTRKFVSFSVKDEDRLISGLRIPISRVRAVAGALGVSLSGEKIGIRDVLPNLRAKERIELDNGWQLRTNQAGHIVIDGLGMKAARDNGIVVSGAYGKLRVEHGAAYAPTKGYFYLPHDETTIAKFLDRFPLKGQAQMQASKDLRSGEAGFIRTQVLVPITPSRQARIADTFEKLKQMFSVPQPRDVPPERGLAPLREPGRPAAKPEMLPPEPRRSAGQRLWVRGWAARYRHDGLEPAAAESRANDLWHAMRRIHQAGQIMYSELEGRSKETWKSYGQELRDRVGEVLMSVHRDLETGELVMGALQPIGTLEVRRVKNEERARNVELGIDIPLDQALRGGELPGDLVIGERLHGRPAEIQLYYIVRPEAARLAYESLISDRPEAKELIEALTGMQEELRVDPLVGLINLPPMSREVAKKLYKIGVSHPPEYAHFPMRRRQARTFIGRIRAVLTKKRSPHRLRSRGILFRKMLYEQDPKKALYQEAVSFIREQVADAMVLHILPEARVLAPGEGVPEGYALLDNSMIRNPDAFAAFVDRNAEDLAERGLDPKELKSFGYQMGVKRVIPQEAMDQLTVLLQTEKHSADEQVRAITKASQGAADAILGTVLTGYLLRPVYAVRNFVTNSVNHSYATMTHAYAGMIQTVWPKWKFTELPFAYFVSAVEAPILNARPFNRELRRLIPDEMLGQQFIQSLDLKRRGVLSEVLRLQGGRAGDIYVNRIAKTTIARGYARNLYSFYQRTGKWPEGRKMPFEQFYKELLESIPREVDNVSYKWADTYGAFDYWNMPPRVEQWTRNRIGRAIFPFPKWFAKEWSLFLDMFGLPKHLKTLWSSDSTNAERVYALARIMAASTIAWLVWSLIPDSYEEMPDGIDESMIPYELRRHGYVKVPLLKTARDEDYWLRTVDIPVVGWAVFAKYLARGDWEAAREIFDDKLSLGPLPTLVAPLFNLVDEYNKFKPIGQRMGEFMFRQLPFSAHLELMRKVIDPEKKGLAKATDSFADQWWNGFSRQLPKLSMELKAQQEQAFPHRRIEYDIREAMLRFLLWNVKIIDPAERESAIRKAKMRQFFAQHPEIPKPQLPQELRIPRAGGGGSPY